MNKLLCSLVAVLSMNYCFSQVNISPNILAAPFQGDRFTMKSSTDVEGTPMLFDSWKTGKVILSNGDVYTLEKLNFDASTLKFIYSIKDTVFELQDNVKQVKIDDNQGGVSELVFRNDALPGKTYFVQILTNGKISILRQFSKRPEGENYTNGIVNETRKYVLRTADVVLQDGNIIPVTYGPTSLTQLTSDRKNEVDKYIKENHLKPKKEEDFLKVISFYNSLP
ncbi:MAG: hypothetical protein ACXVBH_12395 [Flavisolibacter sp.]